jgi:hypothetical protein
VLLLVVATSSAGASSTEVRAGLIRLAAIDAADRHSLTAGTVVSRALPSDVGHETASIHLVQVNVPPAYAVAAYDLEGMAIETASADEIGRLDGTVGVSAFATLTIDDSDLGALARCTPGSCKVKLPRGWIHRFRGEIDWGGGAAAREAHALYASLLADYVDRYRQQGTPAMLRYEDKRDPVSAASQFDEILAGASVLCDNFPGVCGYLRAPERSDARPTTRLLWQKEDIGTSRRVTTLVEQVHLREEASSTLLVLSKQLYANHYYEGALGITWVGPTEDGRATLVAHALWARVDALRGWSLFRGRIHRGVRDGLSARVEALRDRLEQRWTSEQERLAR